MWSSTRWKNIFIKDVRVVITAWKKNLDTFKGVFLMKNQEKSQTPKTPITPSTKHDFFIRKFFIRKQASKVWKP